MIFLRLSDDLSTITSCLFLPHCLALAAGGGKAFCFTTESNWSSCWVPTKSHARSERQRTAMIEKKIEISRNDIQTNKQLSLIVAAVRIQQSSTLLCTLYFLVIWLQKYVHFTETQLTNDKDCLIGADVGLQQSHMNEQERQRASLD